MSNDTLWERLNVQDNIIDEQAARIAELEAALREIAELRYSLPLQEWAVDRANLALKGAA